MLAILATTAGARDRAGAGCWPLRPGAGGTLRVALTATDVPTTTGAPDNGGEGMRFLGFPVFESLVLWDLTRADKLAEIRPGLAESWEQDKNDQTKWIFHLRKGVKFHDGTDWNADAAIWNLDRFLKQDAPQFDPPNAAVTQARNPYYANYRKIDDYTIEIGTPRPISYFPNMVTWMLYVEPGAVQEDRVVGGVREGAGRHGPVQDRRVQAAGQRDAGAQRRILGSRPGCRSSTRSSCFRCRKRRPGCRRCAPARSIGSRCRRRMRCRASNRPGSTSSPTAIRIPGHGPSTWPRRTRPSATSGFATRSTYCVNRDGLVTLLNGLAEPAVRPVQEGRPVFRQPEAAIHLRPGQGARRC